MKWIINRIIISCILLVSIIAIIYIAVDYSNSNVIARYFSMQNQQATTVDGKKLNFLTSYYSETQDYTLSKALGKDSDMSSSNGGSSDSNDSSTDSDTDTSYGSEGSSAWDKSNVDKALKEHANKWGYNVEIWEKIQHNGNIYIAQRQAKNNVVGTIANTEGQTLGSAGCMWYAIGAAASTVKGEVIGVEDLLVACGYNVTIGEHSATVSPALLRVGQDPSVKSPNGTPLAVVNILSAVGINSENLSASSKGQDLSLGSFDKFIYIVHIKGDPNKLLSSGDNPNAKPPKIGEHWFVVVDDNGSNYLLLRGGGTEGTDNIVPKSLFKDFDVNRIIKIER